MKLKTRDLKSAQQTWMNNEGNELNAMNLIIS